MEGPIPAESDIIKSLSEMPNKPTKPVGLLVALANTLTKIIHPKFAEEFKQPWLQDTNVIQVNRKCQN